MLHEILLSLSGHPSPLLRADLHHGLASSRVLQSNSVLCKRLPFDFSTTSNYFDAMVLRGELESCFVKLPFVSIDDYNVTSVDSGPI